MKTDGLSNEQAFALLNARVELHYLERTGVGGAAFSACMLRLLIGVLLTAGCVLLVAHFLGDSPWIVAVALVGIALSTAWVCRYDSVRTSERITLLKQVIPESQKT